MKFEGMFYNKNSCFLFINNYDAIDGEAKNGKMDKIDMQSDSISGDDIWN